MTTMTNQKPRNPAARKALQIIIPSGKPNGIKVISAPGWSGECLIVPRQSISELKDRLDNNKPGLYILFGQDESTSEKLAYIGESESFFARITSHDAQKDFWDTAVIFTKKLNRAYVKYLEHRATLLASEASRMVMQNKVQPQENTLSEFDKIAVDDYFIQMQFILSSMGYEIFDLIDNSMADATMYYLKGNGFNAQAKLLENGNVLVLAGSVVSITESASFDGWAKAARTEYLSQGKLIKRDELSYEFTSDQLFRKPSPAAAVIAARSINGWTAWKDAHGNTLDQNQR